MPRLILVRHAMPVVVEGADPATWRLDERGREDCVLLAHHLRHLESPVVYASPEPKAHETGAVLALRLRGRSEIDDDAFREATRPSGWIVNYEEMAAAYLHGEPMEGWEPPDAVVARFEEGVARAREANVDSDVVVATHGLAMALYLASLGVVEAVPFWRCLTFPDAWAAGLGDMPRGIKRLCPL